MRDVNLHWSRFRSIGRTVRSARSGPGARELRKEGEVVRLREQPFQVLLLERRGEWSPEELRERLW